MIKLSLPLRVLGISFIVLALPLLIDSFIFFQNAYESSIEDAKGTLRSNANFRAFGLAEADPVRQVFLQEMEVLLEIAKELTHLPNDKFNKELERITDNGAPYEIYILNLGDENNNFKILASSDPKKTGEYLKSFTHLREAIGAGSGNFIQFQYNSSEGIWAPYLNISKVIYNKNNDPLGVLLLTYNAENHIAPLVKSESKNDRTINYAILNGDEIIFAASDSRLLGQMLRPVSSQHRMEIELSHELGENKIAPSPLPIIEEEQGDFFEFVFNDQIEIAYIVPVPNIDIYFLAYSTKEEIFSSSIRHFLWIYSIYGLILVIGGAVTYWLTQWMSRPLKQLSYVMGKVRAGEMDVRFQEAPLGFEINLLGSIFNQTLDSLLESMQKAEDERVLKETYEKELEIGRDVQRKLLPQKMPMILGIELASTYISSKEVGGDFYDVMEKDTKLFLTIADAAGKGIPSCLYALGVRSLLRTYACLSDDVGVVLCNTNNMFMQDTGDTGMFVTTLQGVYDTATKNFSYYSCGHVPGILRKKNGKLIMLSHRGMALGLMHAKEYKAESIILESGDILILYTDGLIDFVNEKGQRFTMRRLCDLLQHRKWDTAKEVIEGLTAEIQSFQSSDFNEEITILAMKVE